jgi:hypothetical protein
MEAHRPAEVDKATVYAIRALAAGVASEGQQKAALDWIIRHAARGYDLSYRPQDATATAFAEGRRFVALQIIEMTLPETLKRVEAAEVAAKAARRTKKET